MSKEKESIKDELITVLQLVAIFAFVILGREAGRLYYRYQGVSKLDVNFQVREEDLAKYLQELLAGKDPNLRVGLSFKAPGQDEADIVIETPEYVRRWLIGVTAVPVQVIQPEISDVKLQVFIEGAHFHEETYKFPREKISYLIFLEREISIDIPNKDELRGLVREASQAYGGEVAFRFTGSAVAHILFLSTDLSFNTTVYPLVDIPHSSYVSSEWRSQEGVKIKSSQTGKLVYVAIQFENPTRVHSIKENVTCTFYHEGSSKNITQLTKEISVAPKSSSTWFFSFTPEEPGIYTYSISTEGGSPFNDKENDNLIIEP